MFLILFLIMIISLIHFLFFSFSKKNKWEQDSKSIFECGFTSYFFSRFSFSIHYFLIALTFLLLDLELCFLMPFFNEESTSIKSLLFFFTFTLILTLGLLTEWKMGMIEWKS